MVGWARPSAGAGMSDVCTTPDGTPIIYWVFSFRHIILLMFDSLGRAFKTDSKIYDVVLAEK